MSPLRRKMDPDSLNMLLFLKANRKLWVNARIIQQKILNDRPGVDADDDALADESEDETIEDYDDMMMLKCLHVVLK